MATEETDKTTDLEEDREEVVAEVKVEVATIRISSIHNNRVFNSSPQLEHLAR